jgi:steroid 5-alpha reductase family enzyme
MVILWLVHFRIRNAAIVDAGWSAGMTLLAIIYAFGAEGYPWRRILIAGMATVWGLRLAIHLLVDRIIGKPEEGRYRELREKWGAGFPRRLFWFYQMQAVAAVVLSLPFLLAALNDRTRLAVPELAGALLWVVAFVGEAMADRQLAAFKRDPANRGKTCARGLWRYSRHPNYFFEWLIWCAYALVSTAAPYGWIGWLSPLLMLYFLFRVTGIPATEAQALRSRGDEYRAYQESTSAFFPWFPRN